MLSTLPLLCVSMPVTTMPQLNALQTHTYVYAAICVVLALAFSMLVAALIPFQGGKDKSYIKRRIAYIVIGLIEVIAFFVINDLAVKGHIVKAGMQSMFMRTNLICLSITIGGYVVLGLIIMLLFRRSKFGSILGKIKDK